MGERKVVMTTRRSTVWRVSRVGAAVAALLLGVMPVYRGGQGVHAASAPLKATQMMNFFPQPELGGQYAGIEFGTYKKYNLDVTMATFNPKASNCEALVATGRVDFCLDDADGLLNARQQGIPAVAVMDIFQTNPLGWMWHAENKTMRSVADLSGNHLIYVFGSSYFDYLQKKYRYTNITTQNYDFTLRAFLHDPKAVNQCYISSEPFTAREQGARVAWGLVAASGYNPYSQLVITSEAMVKNHPDVVSAFVRGSVDGWKAYFQQPEKVFSYLRAAPGASSYPLTRAAMRFGFSQVKPLVAGGEAASKGIGYIDPARMTLLKTQMTSVGIKLDKVDVLQAFTDRFLAGM